MTKDELEIELEKQKEANKQLVKDKQVADAKLQELMRQQYRD